MLQGICLVYFSIVWQSCKQELCALVAGVIWMLYSNILSHYCKAGRFDLRVLFYNTAVTINSRNCHS